jgi:hypothetical protein
MIPLAPVTSTVLPAEGLLTCRPVCTGLTKITRLEGPIGARVDSLVDGLVLHRNPSQGTVSLASTARRTGTGAFDLAEIIRPRGPV